MNYKNSLLAVVILSLIGGGVYFYYHSKRNNDKISRDLLINTIYSYEENLKLQKEIIKDDILNIRTFYRAYPSDPIARKTYKQVCLIENLIDSWNELYLPLKEDFLLKNNLSNLDGLLSGENESLGYLDKEIEIINPNQIPVLDQLNSIYTKLPFLERKGNNFEIPIRKPLSISDFKAHQSIVYGLYVMDRINFELLHEVGFLLKNLNSDLTNGCINPFPFYLENVSLNEDTITLGQVYSSVFFLERDGRFEPKVKQITINGQKLQLKDNRALFSIKTTKKGMHNFKAKLTTVNSSGKLETYERSCSFFVK
jgi:hypothetical protein